jgi:NAD(P)-dependent dehydrogenase (short-subunit alcohol dehydrogenase family)
VCPGIIDTPIHSFHNSKTEKESLEKNISNIQLLKNLGKPEDVAEALFFLGCEKSKFTTASILNVDGGINIK